MLYRREEMLRTIGNALNWIQLACKQETLLHLMNNNTVSEHFYCEFLNRAFGLSLVNLNKVAQNYPALDLGDVGRRIAFQVTVNGKAKKIQETLTKCDPQYTTPTGKKPNITASDYDHIKFIVIGNRQRKYGTLKVPLPLVCDPNTDILGVKELLKHVDTLPTNKLSDLVAVITQELKVGTGIILAIPHTDTQALEVCRRHFDRPFMQDDWHGERSFSRFQFQCEEAISLLNSGVLNQATVTKSRHDFGDPQDAQILEDIYHRLRNVLAEFRKRTISKGGMPPEIDLQQNVPNFEVPATIDLFNALRQGITDQVNVLCKKHGLNTIRGVLR